MSIKGFEIDGTIQRYVYSALDNAPVPDVSLSKNGVPADAATVGDAITEITITGVSNDARNALMTLLEHVQYTDENKTTYLNNLRAALFPSSNS